MRMLAPRFSRSILSTFTRPALRGALLAAASCAALAGCAGNGYVVSEVGSFHVGGKQVSLSGLPEREIVFTPGAAPLKVNPNGDFEAGQMYAQYVKLAQPKAKYPLLLVHGGGLTGVTWETKPDGAPGWQQFFLKAGHTVYVNDAVERGRASWARYPEIYSSEPFFRTKKEGWELFRIGLNGSYDTDPGKRKAIEGTQFPIQAFDQFIKQGVPRWSSNDAATQAAYDAYVQKVCPCVIIVHSQGGNFALQAALNNPGRVKAIVAVESSGSPDPDKTDWSALKATPVLFVWGDNLAGPPFWQGIAARMERVRQKLLAQGGVADRLELPQAGIRGNSHMMMMDRNSDQIAQLIQDWLTRQGLMK